MDRATQAVDLTEIGEAASNKLPKYIENVDDIEAVISSETEQFKGALQVNALPSFAHLHIASHLPLFADCYPDIHLDLMTAENNSENMLRQVDIQILALKRRMI